MSTHVTSSCKERPPLDHWGGPRTQQDLTDLRRWEGKAREGDYGSRLRESVNHGGCQKTNPASTVSQDNHPQYYVGKLGVFSLMRATSSNMRPSHRVWKGGSCLLSCRGTHSRPLMSYFPSPLSDIMPVLHIQTLTFTRTSHRHTLLES